MPLIVDFRRGFNSSDRHIWRLNIVIGSSIGWYGAKIKPKWKRNVWNSKFLWQINARAKKMCNFLQKSLHGPIKYRFFPCKLIVRKKSVPPTETIIKNSYCLPSVPWIRLQCAPFHTDISDFPSTSMTLPTFRRLSLPRITLNTPFAVLLNFE